MQCKMHALLVLPSCITGMLHVLLHQFDVREHGMTAPTRPPTMMLPLQAQQDRPSLGMSESFTGKLNEKDELLRKEAQEKQQLQKRIQNLERLILRGDGANIKVRHFLKNGWPGALDLC